MNRRQFLAITTTVPWMASGATARFRKPAAPASEPDSKCFRPGDRVSPEVFFVDRELERVTLANQVNEFTKIIYLFLFGGAYAVKPADKRGGLWCVDTVDDLSLHRAILYSYAERGVTFVPVAMPPVYGSGRYGYPDNVFLTEPADSAAYRKAVEAFVTKTEALKGDGSLPFDPIFYDPRFRLLDNPSEHEHVPAYGQHYPWQGRFKGCDDDQLYGTPTTWLLDRDLKVVTEPFYGNVYETTPLHINYTVRDVAAALDQALR